MVSTSNVARLNSEPHTIDNSKAATEFARPAWISERLFPFRSRFIQLDNARLHYVDEGTGPTLLLLHGSPMWSFLFRHAIGMLKNNFRCVAVDMPGLGLSRAPLARGAEFAQNARIFREFVERLDLRDITVIAHATACPPALRMALDLRARVAGIVITNGFAWSMSEYPSMWRFVRIVGSPIFQFLAKRTRLLPWLTTRLARSTGRLSREERTAILSPYRDAEERRHLAALLAGLSSEVPFFTEVERELTMLRDLPVLLLYGANDHGYQAGFVERWRKLLPQSDVVVLNNCGHFPQEDEPEEYTAALSKWLTKRPAILA